jgi:hypothetical protein
MSDDPLAEVLGHYATLRRSLQRTMEKGDRVHLPHLEQTRLAQSLPPPIPFAQADELATAMQGYESGWIARQSGVTWFSPERAEAENAASLGRVLQAELATGDRSLHVHFDSALQGWRLAYFEENGSNGASYLAESMTLLSEISGLDLRYRRYWGKTADGSMRPLHARFCGFVKGESDVRP